MTSQAMHVDQSAGDPPPVAVAPAPPGFEILHEDSALLVVNKPAGLVCHPTKPDGHSSLISRLRMHLGPATPPHLINRLDRETSGVVLVGKEPRAALALRRLWEQRLVRKEYWAIVHGHVRESRGTIDAPLGRDEQSLIAVKDAVRPDGAPAQTEFEAARRFTRAEGDFSLLRVWPLTGRKHQVRIHLAHLGHPVVGDKLYGGDEECYLAFAHACLTDAQRARLILPHQALHARAVRFQWRGTETTFCAEPERWFPEFIAAAAESSLSPALAR
jgi:23S rRNA pseudouridine1911/1915/1917 synthase